MAYDSEITPTARDLVVLERARAIVAAGWAQGGSAESGRASYRENETSHCAMNAICIAVCDTQGVQDFDHAATLIGFDWPGAVWCWNDDPERTKAEVLARFDAAISKLGEA